MAAAKPHSRVIAPDVIAGFLKFSLAWRHSDSATMKDSIHLCQFHLLSLSSQAPNAGWLSDEPGAKNDDKISWQTFGDSKQP
jgi:hypothetical protein